MGIAIKRLSESRGETTLRPPPFPPCVDQTKYHHLYFWSGSFLELFANTERRTPTFTQGYYVFRNGKVEIYDR